MTNLVISMDIISSYEEATMAKRKFNIMEEAAVGPVGQLLNDASLSASGQGQKITFLPRELLVPNEKNSEVYIQTENDSKYLEELDATARDIATVGIRQPLIVFKNESEQYTVISGNRRLAASAVAVEKYSEECRKNGVDCDRLPCIIQPAPKTEAGLRKRMIKDNLQRTKSGYERMMEIIVYRDATKEEWEAEGCLDHPPLREVLRTDLAATDAEITRYLKINDSLLPGLMERFKTTMPDGVPYIKTAVAHRLAKAEPEAQQHVLDSFAWDSPLTDASLTSIMTGFYAQQAAEERGEAAEEAGDADTPPDAPAVAAMPPAPATQKPAPVATYQFTSIHDGITRLSQTCSTLSSTVTATKGIPEKVERRLMKKIAAEMLKLEALAAELRNYQGTKDGSTE